MRFFFLMLSWMLVFPTADGQKIIHSIDFRSFDLSDYRNPAIFPLKDSDFVMYRPYAFGRKVEYTLVRYNPQLEEVYKEVIPGAVFHPHVEFIREDQSILALIQTEESNGFSAALNRYSASDGKIITRKVLASGYQDPHKMLFSENQEYFILYGAHKTKEPYGFFIYETREMKQTGTAVFKLEKGLRFHDLAITNSGKILIACSGKNDKSLIIDIYGKNGAPEKRIEAPVPSDGKQYIDQLSFRQQADGTVMVNYLLTMNDNAVKLIALIVDYENHSSSLKYAINLDKKFLAEKVYSNYYPRLKSGKEKEGLKPGKVSGENKLNDTQISSVYTLENGDNVFLLEMLRSVQDLRTGKVTFSGGDIILLSVTNKGLVKWACGIERDARIYYSGSDNPFLPAWEGIRAFTWQQGTGLGLIYYNGGSLSGKDVTRRQLDMNTGKMTVSRFLMDEKEMIINRNFFSPLGNDRYVLLNLDGAGTAFGKDFKIQIVEAAE